jgi:hypothetical protein
MCGPGILSALGASDSSANLEVSRLPFAHCPCLRTPDGLSILIVAEFCVRMTVWNLVDRRCSYLPGPKHTTRGLSFHPADSTMVVLEVTPAVAADAANSRAWPKRWGAACRESVSCLPGSPLPHCPPRHCSARSARTWLRCTSTQPPAAGASEAGALNCAACVVPSCFTAPLFRPSTHGPQQ